MLTKTKKILLLSLIVSLFAMSFFVLLGHSVSAQTSLDLPSSFAGFSSQDLKTTIENIVRIVLGFVGFIFLLLLLYAGFLWMTSGGDEKKITRAKKIITSAVIGLLVTLSAYAIASFIINSFTGAANNGGSTSSSSTGPGGFGFALGSGALESHYPGRNAVNVPRNTNIYITFKQAMDVKTICDPGPDGVWGTADDPNRLLVSSIELMDVNSLEPADSNDVANDNTLEGVTCAPTDASNTTFKFHPTALLGTGNGDVPYNVILVPHKIMTADGQDALALGYSWRFTVNSVVDTTPPRIISVYPNQGDVVPRNTIVQINFSEPVDPSLAAGLYAPPGSTYGTITLDDTNPSAAPYIAGSYNSGNQYQTTEFISNQLCGMNSCGENVYCLPGPGAPLPAKKDIYGFVSSAITDMAGNHLDGEFPAPYTFPSGDGTAGGDFKWQFQTTDDLDLTAPKMIARTPRSTAIDWPLGDPIQMDFSKPLSTTSLRSSNVGLGRTQNPYVGPAYVGPPYPGPVTNEGNFWISSINGNFDPANPGNVTTRVFINHDLLRPLTPYHPGANSQVRDLTQNCYFPAVCSVAGSC